VIKVEQPGSGDESRSYEPVAERNGARDSAYFFACNRGKRSVTVNLRHKDGQALVRDLIRHCDAVVENFPTGTLKRYGLDWEALRAINPRLVMLSCTGFGQTGPYARRKGYDTVFQAMSGLLALTGERGGGPVKPGLPIADLTSGLWITIGRGRLNFLRNFLDRDFLAVNGCCHLPGRGPPPPIARRKDRKTQKERNQATFHKM
jgi:crotonobetainyl-CoA:carnitine CoA-transferase CaiB-like acyl-CoA transferase